MSHLPLDARAILEYLNELGYRNISAEQLKEFMKGMQPQSEINTKQKATATTSSNNQQSLPTTTAAITNQPNRKQYSPKIIKGKKPLSHFKFYLDIRDHLLTKKIEQNITTLGGSLEFFLTPSVTHFITDKTVLAPTVNNNNTVSRPGTPQTPATPSTPQTPYSYEHSPYDSTRNAGSALYGTPNGGGATSVKKQSRADAMLNRARHQSSGVTHVQEHQTPNNHILSTPTGSNATLQYQHTQTYSIWQTEYALRFFKKVTHDLKEYLEASQSKKSNSSCTVEPTSLKGSFLKIESIKRNQRPYFQLFRKPTEWPKIELDREDGAFRLSPKHKKEPGDPRKEIDHTKMTRKSRSRSSQRQTTAAVPPSVQALKKGEVTKSSNAGPQPNSNVAHTACKQAKESSDKQCGVCEICKIEYDTLTIHLKTKDHEYFAKNSQNFIALDTLIHASADVNKFLDSNKELEVKSELEEMELAEEDAAMGGDAADPLENEAHLLQKHSSTSERNRIRNSQKTKSPSLREKSKRSTKGKHSSEKFQNVSTAKSSPKTPQKALAVSPQKKLVASSSMLELQKIKDSAPIAAVTPTTRRKPSSASLISPPIRAMLPPSSLYKVVETQEICTPTRKTRDALDDTAVASPSLIVKFKKVRQTELSRLNGEAENFMFPKQRTSSELPTDLDRQTTSENTRVSMSSTSLDSTSEQHMDIDMENGDFQNAVVSDNIATSTKAIAVGKRRKARPGGKQSFPIAPIQPEFALKRLRSPAAAVVASGITLPEATRKSSRTATAIVTAATTSSRLLRAAVEAAKNNQRLETATHKKKSSSLFANSATSSSITTATTTTTATTITRRSKTTVVKLEDRMGENDEPDTDETDNDNEEEDDGDDDEEDEESDDEEDDDDEDYVGNFRGYPAKQKSMASSNRQKRFSNRDQRAVTRETTRFVKKEPESDEEKESKPLVKTKTKTGPPSRKKVVAPQISLDVNKSECLSNLRYAFERLPSNDLWYQVFKRQDACEEQIYEYYGSTNYRKLPYEMGPIPFDRTLDGICCALCNRARAADRNNSDIVDSKSTKSDIDLSEPNVDVRIPKTQPTSAEATTSSQTGIGSCSTYTHKKLHLLQRYRQEQQELLQKQQEEQVKKEQSVKQLIVGQNESKASTPDREPLERAGSTHSNASSSASSAGTFSKKFPRNKHLSKAAFLSLELPPRKSPREHASTLALVSCIIKQRQDSQSKPNSETDEPSITPTPMLIAEELKPPLPPPVPPEPPAALRSPRSTRSAAATPVEELRFATEISENVKRLRRGQNKYDHSPTIATSSRSRARNVPPTTQASSSNQHGNLTPTKRKRRQKGLPASTSYKHHSHSGHSAQGKIPSIRKTGSKKGVLEFEMDASALRDLDNANQYTNVRQLEWEIDKYLQIAGMDIDLDVQLDSGICNVENSESTSQVERAPEVKASSTTQKKSRKSQTEDKNTPPPTDYFSSDFDLYDLFTSSENATVEDPVDGGVAKGLSLYSSSALQSYFRKRKSLKSNRTGWPKIQKKKTSARQQQKLNDKIRFLQAIGEPPGLVLKQEPIENEELRDQTRESGVITPPDSDADDNEEDDADDRLKLMNDGDDACDAVEAEAEDTEMDVADSIPEEDDADTMADSVDDREADVEEDDDEEGMVTAEEDEDNAVEEEDLEYYEPENKRTRNSSIPSPMEKLTPTLTSSGVATSTPSTQLLRGLRRTPQLNGSLGSCVSPSEKAGDNSDIFTVSSDGLDTDLDLSNSHSQLKGGDDHDQHFDFCANHTPKRKYDLAKYASKNSATSTCAAEAATAAAKSMAISQFLKKEVKVTCRRLRAPFRRFRYRR